MKFVIVREHMGVRDECVFDYAHSESKRPMALDVLLQAKSVAMADLAFRYGCRNELCGVCTIEVNGQPRLACRARLDEGDRLSALTALPVLADLVVEREAINKQLRGVPAVFESPTHESPPAALSSLGRCIECYACISECPMHQRNDLRAAAVEKELHFGNPYTLLKLQRAMLEPSRSSAEKQEILDRAVALGLSSCLDCDGCKCQVGISLPAEVIEPLLHAAASALPNF